MNRKMQNGHFDPQRQAVLAALSPYQTAHPAAQIDIRRRHGIYIAIRIVDPAFYGIFWADREDEIWSLLQQLPDEIFANISLLLLLTPDEVATSGANIEFENPTPWPLKEAALHGRKIMGVQEQKGEDVQVQEIYNALAPYQAAHVNAQIDVRRRHEVSIHIRVIDPDFRGTRQIAREDLFWPLLHQLPYETLADVTLLLLLTPEETATSLANMEFENPVTWPLEEDSLLVIADD